MFFMRLRRSTKPIFIVLAVVFALSFVFLGVGSGSSGIGDLLRGNFSLFSRNSGGPSLKNAQDRVAKNPHDPAAYRALATAYETKNDIAGAASALQDYTRLRPKDIDAQRELAALYLRQADAASLQASTAQAQAQAFLNPAGFAPPSSAKLQQALGTDPIYNAVSSKANAAFSTAYQSRQRAYTQAVAAYRQIAKLSPRDPTVQLQLAQTAEAASDPTTAVQAYKQFLKLAPDDPSAGAVKKRIKQLQAQPTLGSATTG